MNTVLTLGTFDTPHAGHVKLLEACRVIAGRAGKVIVALNTDDFVARFKRFPAMRLEERMAVISAIKHVDEVYVNDGADQAELIRHLEPTILAIGIDWAHRDYHAQLGITPEWLTQHGIVLVYVSAAVMSSTEIRERILGSERA